LRSAGDEETHNQRGGASLLIKGKKIRKKKKRQHLVPELREEKRTVSVRLSEKPRGKISGGRERAERGSRRRVPSESRGGTKRKRRTPLEAKRDQGRSLNLRGDP